MKKTGFIAIVGRPNAGKSTLLNAMLGEKIAITSKTPQTTRTRITGILTQGENQFVFIDTPGMHRSMSKLGSYMNRQISSALADVDAVILVADAGYMPGDIEQKLIRRFQKDGLPMLLALNKTDLTNLERLGQVITAYAQLADFASVIPVSALKENGVSVVLDEAEKLLHEGEWIFDEDALTDQPERVIAAEMIREKILRLTENEIPHGTAVVIEEFTEGGGKIRIRAEIYCDRESHKRILIGKGGEMLKKIGSYAREDMERFFDSPVYLDLWVKVKENWRESDFLLDNFGFKKEGGD